MQSVSSIFHPATKHNEHAKFLLDIEVEPVKKSMLISVNLVSERNKNNRHEYLILASADIKLSEEEIIQTYGKCWSIEFFFKICNSFLKLGKKNRSMSYDAMTAHVSILFARYTILSLKQRQNADKRSINTCSLPHMTSCRIYATWMLYS